MDLENEGRAVSLETLRRTDALKTGALIRAACVLGCIAADASPQQCKAAEAYAYALGMAFQIVDDILDVTGDTATLGKPAGSDAQQNKSTYVTLCGPEGAKEDARAFTQAAVDALDVFGEAGDALRTLAGSLCERNK